MEKEIMDEKVPFVKGYTGILAYYTGNVIENFKKAEENIEKDDYRKYLDEAAKSYVNALEYIIDRKTEYARSQNPQIKEWNGIKVKEYRDIEKQAKAGRSLTAEEKDTYDKALIHYQTGKLHAMSQEISEIMMNIGKGNLVNRTAKAVKDMVHFKTMESLMDYAHEAEKAKSIENNKDKEKEETLDKNKKRLVYQEIKETLEKELKNIREKNREAAEKRRKIDNKNISRRVSKGMER